MTPDNGTFRAHGESRDAGVLFRIVGTGGCDEEEI